MEPTTKAPDAPDAPDARDARGTSWPWLLAAAALGVGLLVLNVVRASTQSLTHDEALTMLWFVAGPIERVFADFQPNNHVLHTALVWLSARQLGYSELALRLPSLLGGALCLAAGFGVCRALLGSRALFLLGYALLVLNPLLLDFLSAARGYGLASGFLLLALLQVLHLLRAAGTPPTRPDDAADAASAAGAAADVTGIGGGSPGGRGRAALASVAAILAVACNLSVAPACAGLVCIAVLGVCTDRRRTRRLGTAAMLMFPALLLGLALLARSLPDAGRGASLVGLPTWTDSALDLVQRSLAHHDARWPLDTQGALFAAERDALALVGLPLLLATLALVVAARARRFHALRPAQRALLVAGGTLVATVAQWIALHVALGVPWPMDRTGLVLIVLGAPCAVALAHAAWQRRGALHAGGAAVLALLTFLALQQAFQLQATHYTVWRYDAGARQLFAALREHQAERVRDAEGHGAQGDGPTGAPPADDSVRLVLGSWMLEPALSFYRLQTRTRWLAPIERAPFDPQAPWDYLITPPPLPSGVDARVIAADPVSGALLAVPLDGR